MRQRFERRITKAQIVTAQNDGLPACAATSSTTTTKDCAPAAAPNFQRQVAAKAPVIDVRQLERYETQADTPLPCRAQHSVQPSKRRFRGRSARSNSHHRSSAMSLADTHVERADASSFLADFAEQNGRWHAA